MGHTGLGSDDDSDLSDDDSPKKRRDLLTRRPSYRKILNDLGEFFVSLNDYGDAFTRPCCSGDDFLFSWN